MTTKMSAKAILFIVISIVGFIFFALFDKQVFPAASIDMKISQDEAGAKSKQLATSLGYDVEQARHVTIFSEDDKAKTVLEFKMGIDKANALMKDQVPVWFWRTRYCKELSNDEIIVAWTTQGKFKSVYHKFDNDKKLKTISQDDALALAKQFIAGTAGLDLTGYDLFDRGSETKPTRTDHHFTWSKPGFSESEYRVTVEISGDQVAYCRYWLAPKDKWDREYAGIRQYNELLGNIASLFLFLFIGATVGAFVYGVAQHNIRWRFTLICSALVSILVLLESLNNFNYSLDTYDTTITYSSFLTQTALLYFLASVGSFLASVLIVGGAEVVYRATRPTHMAMEHLFTLPGMAQKAYGGKTLMGYLLVGVMMFWAIGYYKVGQKFGYFCPLGVDDYKVLGNFCPAISGALIGVSAAGLEEFTCRVVGLGLLQKVTKSFWLANLLQALIWGFAHSNYPQEPCYARGVELTVVGLLFGYIVKVYGVLPCLIAHYLYDAFLTVEPVFASHKPELIVPSLLILLPFACAVWYSRSWARSKGIEVEAVDLSNGAGSSAEPPGRERAEDIDQENETPVYSALNGNRKKTLLLTAVLCLSLLFIPAGDQIGKAKQVSITASRAQELAAKYLSDDGLDFKDYQCVSQLLARPNGAPESKLMWQHVYEMLGPEKTKTVYNQAAPGLQWQVRFFKPLEPRSYRVYLNGDGSKLYIDVEDLDEAKGAKLDEAGALAMVQQYIEKNRPELLPIVVDNKTKIVRAKRADYKFDFLEPKFAANQTPAILHAETKGDKVSLLNLDWNVPDNWLWPRKQQQPVVLTAMYVRNIAVVILAGLCLIWGVHLLRITRVPWRSSLATGLLWSVIAILAVFNSSSKSLINYDTAETWQTFVGQTLAGQATRCLLQTIGCCIISVAGYTALKQAFPSAWQQLRSWVLLRPKTAEQQIVRSNIWIDGALASYAFSAALVALKTVQGLALFHFSPEAPIDIQNRLASLFSTSLPIVDLMAYVFGWMIGAPLLLAVFASLWQKYFKAEAKALPLTLIIVMAILCGVDSWYWQNCLIDTACCLLRFLLVWYFLRKVFATNTLAYLFALGEITSALYLGDLISHAGKIGALEITALLFVILAPALLTVLFWRLDRAKS